MLRTPRARSFETVEAEAEYYRLKYQDILETLNETRLELGAPARAAHGHPG